jgi:UDP-N-acetylmuramoyl-tripeptide--D-alanyl-D-alanine ligase
MRWTLEQVAAALGVAPPAGVDPLARLAGVSIDSRTLRDGELFVAIHGPRHDGHAFVAAALAAGAPAGVVARGRLADFPEEVRRRLFAVDDPRGGLQQLARAVRRKWGAQGGGRRLVAITGSTGKTTTKEILAALLGARLRVLKSEGNLNNEYGLPLTLLRLEEEHEAAVVEVGMSRRRELARLAEICEPEVGVVTNVAPVHLEFFASVEEIALAKRELIEGLRGAGSVAVLNANDARVARFAEVAPGRVVTFGDAGDFRAENAASHGANGWEFEVVTPQARARLRLSLGGPHLENALAALAAASVLGVGLDEAAQVFPRLRAAPMRGEVLRFREGFTVINDCYNSNPLALEAMLRLLAETPGARRRILLAGEMLELGPASGELHRAAGRRAAGAVDWIIGVQGGAQEIVAGAIEAGHPKPQAAFYESSEEAAKAACDLVRDGDLLLVKGSRGVKMERIVEALRAKYALADEPAAAPTGRQ